MPIFYNKITPVLDLGFRISDSATPLEGFGHKYKAIYTSRLLNFKNLPEPVNSYVTKTTLRSECFDCQLDELDLNEINQEEENNIE
ncbi:hypothetical protein C1646_765717 [Rhizophagus diaphanus]|nr:hypothetical protein C1646_765717 [Rhizophagus diaphanus] [Rhizophagus sp. MUCL 43196]